MVIPLQYPVPSRVKIARRTRCRMNSMESKSGSILAQNNSHLVAGKPWPAPWMENTVQCLCRSTPRFCRRLKKRRLACRESLKWVCVLLSCNCYGNYQRQPPLQAGQGTWAMCCILMNRSTIITMLGRGDCSCFTLNTTAMSSHQELHLRLYAYINILEEACEFQFRIPSDHGQIPRKTKYA
ncbi:hypothetical protein BP00DRAFT_116908 [Aspergillus indologenus CBS 114.80]|uniref:Uncharacterized protein n=1 Tax=Aspergillus indologenus CBS 114.80 TaxID=1450541 RepID=A0A2V5HN16_9EURO|nr:hypothetical protein BP00DRAFT_116908 [Aspergillus indologenus CBS 114.80]